MATIAPQRRKLMRYEEAAEYLGLSVRQLHDRKSRGEVPHIKMGHAVYFDPTLLDMWIEKQTYIPPSMQ